MTRSESLSALVQSATPGELPTLAGELAQALGAVLARAAALPLPADDAVSAEHISDTLLTVNQAAARLGVAPSWLYRHARRLPFSRKLGFRTLRFDAQGLERWAKSQVVKGALHGTGAW